MSATVAEIRAVLSADASSMVRGLGQAKSATRELQAEVARTNSTLQTVRGASDSAGASMRGISGAADRASAGLREVGNSARQAEAQTRSFSSAASASQGHLGGMTSMLGKAAFAVGGLFTAMAGYKVFNFAKDAIFGFNSTLQGAQMQMGRMLKSEEQATAFISDLKKFAIETPFQFEDLIKASQQFLVYGWKVEDIIPDMEAIGSAAMGDAYKIDMITRALGQMRAKGKVSSEEISMQLGESGIPGWRYVAEAFGVTIPEAMKLAEKGALDVETAIQAILGGMRRDFGGGMQAASKTFKGAMSNVKDAAQQALATGFKPLFDAVSGGLLKLANLMMGERFQNAIKAMTGIAAKYAKPLTEFFDNVIKKLETLDPMKAVAGFERLTGSLSGLQAIAGPLIGTLAGFKMAGGGGGFIGFMAGAILSSEEGREAMKKLAGAMAEVAKEVGPELAKALSRMTPAIVAVAEVISNLVIAFSKLPGPMQEFVILGGLAASIFAKFRSPLGLIVGMLNPFAMGMRRAATETGAAAEQLALFNAQAAATPKAGMFGAGGTLSTMGRGAMSGMMIGGIASTGVAMAGGGTGAQIGSLAGGTLGGAIGSLIAPGAGTVIGGLLGSAAGSGLGMLWDNYNSGADEATKKTKEFKEQWATMISQLSSQKLPDFRAMFGESGFQQAQNMGINAVLQQSEKFGTFVRRLREMGVSYLEFIAAISDRGSLTTGSDLKAVADQLGITTDSLRYLLNFVPELRPFLTRLTNDFTAFAIAEGTADEQAAAFLNSLALVGKRLDDIAGKRTMGQIDKGASATPTVETEAQIRARIQAQFGGEPNGYAMSVAQAAAVSEAMANRFSNWAAQMGVDWEKLTKATRAYAGAARVAAQTKWNDTQSIRETMAVTQQYRDILANQLVKQLGLSEANARALTDQLIKMPTKKIIKIQLERKDYFTAANVEIDVYKQKLEALEGWFGAQDLEVPEALKAEAWADVEPVLQRIIDAHKKNAQSNQAAVYQLEVMKYMYPEMSEIVTTKINEIINHLAGMGEKGMHALQQMKVGHDDLAPSIQAVQEKIIATEIAQSGSKTKMLANIEELKTKYGSDKGLLGVIERIETALLRMDGKKINIKAIFNAAKGEGWENLPGVVLEAMASDPYSNYFNAPDLGALPSPDGKAKGGFVSANRPYIIGEEGPELFMPNKSGTIIPNDQLNKMRSNPSMNAPPFSGMTPVGTTPWENGGQAGPTGANKYVHIENLNVTNAQPNEAANAIVRRLRTEAFLAGN